MTAAGIFRDWRVGMVAGAALLHLTAFAGAWVMVPPGGVETRLDRPMEASLMPAPSNDAVNEDSAPLTQEVVSPVVESETVNEDTVTELAPDAVPAEPVTPPEQSAEPPPVQTLASPPAAPTPAPAQTDQVAALVPDVVTTTNTAQSQIVTAVPETVPNEAAPSETVPAETVIQKPVPEQPKKKAEKPKEQPARKKLVEPPKEKPEVKRLAKLDTTTQIRTARQGGAGAMSDIGVTANAPTNGAAVKAYDAKLRAAVAGRVRAIGGGSCKAGSRVIVSFSVSASGGISAVRPGKSSGDAAFDRVGAAAVSGISPGPPPAGAIRRTIPVDCVRS